MPKDKNFDYQLDLTPFISLLSVCICFLLLTVAWYQIGALSMRQVVGSSSEQGSSGKDSPSLWISLKNNKRTISIKLKTKNKSSQKLIAKSKGDFNYKGFNLYISSLKKKFPNLNQGFILPEAEVEYQSIIKTMDSLRKQGVFNIGISPI